MSAKVYTWVFRRLLPTSVFTALTVLLTAGAVARWWPVHDAKVFGSSAFLYQLEYGQAQLGYVRVSAHGAPAGSYTSVYPRFETFGNVLDPAKYWCLYWTTQGQLTHTYCLLGLSSDGTYRQPGPLNMPEREYWYTWKGGFLSFQKGGQHVYYHASEAGLLDVQLAFSPWHAAAVLLLGYLLAQYRVVLSLFRRYRVSGHCRHCDYDVRASLPFGRCPECGRGFSNDNAAK